MLRSKLIVNRFFCTQSNYSADIVGYVGYKPFTQDTSHTIQVTLSGQPGLSDNPCGVKPAIMNFCYLCCCWHNK